MTALAGAIEGKARELGVWWGSESDVLSNAETLSYAASEGVYKVRMWRETDVLGEMRSWPGDTLSLAAPAAGLWVLLRQRDLHHVFRATATASSEVLADSLQNDGDPLGEVLALWMAGKLEERHVLGVERREHPAEILNNQVEHPEPGWLFAGCICVDGVWQPTGHAYRPALVASA